LLMAYRYVFFSTMPRPPSATLFPYTTLFRSFEHREVGDPQRLPAGLDQVEVLAGLQAHRAHEVADRVVGAGAEEHDVALAGADRSEEHTSELQSRENLVCRLLLEKKNKNTME